jgi:hypothetical protein
LLHRGQVDLGERIVLVEDGKLLDELQALVERQRAQLKQGEQE